MDNLIIIHLVIFTSNYEINSNFNNALSIRITDPAYYIARIYFLLLKIT